MTMLPKRQKKTPFDELIIKLIQKTFENLEQRNEKQQIILTFLEVCRIRYLHLLSITERIQEMLSLVRRGGAVGYPIEEGNFHAIEAKLNYFSFIEELNRFGRLFKDKYNKTLPDYYRIRFYRDKMVEHWDDYEEFLRSSYPGYTLLPNNLVAPYHSGTIRSIEASEDYNRLKSEFEKKGISIPLLNDSMKYEDYSNELFIHLGKIDNELKKHFSAGMINTLFKYSFPIPIYDMEGYIKGLITWVEEFLDQ